MGTRWCPKQLNHNLWTSLPQAGLLHAACGMSVGLSEWKRRCQSCCQDHYTVQSLLLLLTGRRELWMGRNLTLLVLPGWEALLAHALSARQVGWVAHHGQAFRLWCLALLCSWHQPCQVSLHRLGGTQGNITMCCDLRVCWKAEKKVRREGRWRGKVSRGGCGRVSAGSDVMVWHPVCLPVFDLIVMNLCGILAHQKARSVWLTSFSTGDPTALLHTWSLRRKEKDV